MLRRAKKNRKKVITPDDINSLFADKKSVEEEEEEEDEDEDTENNIGGTSLLCFLSPHLPSFCDEFQFLQYYLFRSFSSWQ